MKTIQDRIEKLVEDIMQCGFGVAMGGDMYKTEEENKKLQEEKYNECVAVFSHKIITSIKEVEEKTRKEMITMMEEGYQPFNQEERKLFRDYLKQVKIQSLKEK